jgi:hypothetical protein
MTNKAYKCKRCQKVSRGKKKKGISSFHKKHRCPGCGSFYFFEIDIVDGLIFDFEELIFDYEGEYIPETPPEDYEPLEASEEANMMNKNLEADDPLRMDDAVETCEPPIDDDTSKQSSSFNSGSSSFDSGSSSFDSGSSSFDSGSSSCDSGSSDW